MLGHVRFITFPWFKTIFPRLVFKRKPPFNKIMKVRVVLVEPLWDVNVGSVCRSMKNFGASELYLVNSKAPLGLEAVKFAKHAKNLLAKAKKVSSIKQAVEGCTVVVGTTGVVNRFNKRILKICVSSRELKSKLSSKDKVALLFGNEQHGLDEKTLEECDFVSFIPTKPSYVVMNLSHAVTVFLYELFSSQSKKLYDTAERKKLAQLEKMFLQFASSNKTILHPAKVGKAFKRILRRARPSDDEVQALFSAF